MPSNCEADEVTDAQHLQKKKITNPFERRGEDRERFSPHDLKMLIKLHDNIEKNAPPHLWWEVDGHKTATPGAQPKGAVLKLCLELPRVWGAAAVVCRISPDGGEYRDIPMALVKTQNGIDFYTLSLNTATLCGGAEYGLFYYELLLVRGWDTLFSHTPNNVDLTFARESGSHFRLLVYKKELSAPSWFAGGTMYHIFLDRFCRGEGSVTPNYDAVINPDWANGIPQYARRNGDALSNNVFFGGNLWGVIEKLDYLESLGVTVLYLSPVFEAYSNHRYDTGDYEKIDAFLGGEEAFDALIREAHARGMKIILDGVFNHTGDDSRYFNRKGTYKTEGAYQSPDSPWAGWYRFRNFPEDYECWWGIKILPRLDHTNEECRHYFTGDDGIVSKWTARGVDGWRLDVADELSDEFLDEMRHVVKKNTAKEGLIIGEVWENAVDKSAYGSRRRYLSGDQLDSVMNYPFRNAILALLQNGDAETFYHILTEIYASYPRAVSHSLMNLLGTHDTARILTVLGDEGRAEGLPNDTLAHLTLTQEERKNAIARLKLASVLQFTTFGVPSVYYGDEAGIEGYGDPFCRKPFPWGREDAELLSHYRALGKLRGEHPVLKRGEFRFLEHDATSFAFERAGEGERILVLANVGEAKTFTVPKGSVNALTGEALGTSLKLAHAEWAILSVK